jgi:N-glycosylase/DNA lyase
MKSRSKEKDDLLEYVKAHHRTHRRLIRERLGEFKSVPVQKYFYELAYCLLTPQSSAEHAERVVEILHTMNFQNSDIDPESILRQKEHYIRFHKSKAGYLVKLKGQFPIILKKICESGSAVDKREWLVISVIGLGYKEATHFLRNIGKNDGLAILDRHILRTLKDLGIIRSIPNSMNKKQYLLIEKKFQQFSNDIGIVLDELDLVLWSIGTGVVRK